MKIAIGADHAFPAHLTAGGTVLAAVALASRGSFFARRRGARCRARTAGGLGGSLGFSLRRRLLRAADPRD